MTENLDPPGDQSPADDNKFSSKMPTIFDAMKAGMLIPVQTIVESEGLGVLSQRDERGYTPAHWVCLSGHTLLLRFILDHGGPIDEVGTNEQGQRPIHWACVNGHIAVVDILLQAGVNIDVVDHRGCTPLIVASQYGKTILASYLIGKGARVQCVDKDGDTALHWAAFKGHNELMRLLIYSGFDPHQRDNYNQTPLHLSCICGNLTAVKELVEQDHCDVNIPDKNGKNPLALATGRKHRAIIDYLKNSQKMRLNLLPRMDFWDILFGPPGKTKGPLLFFILSLLVWAYPMYIFKALYDTWYDLMELHIFFWFLNVVMWLSLYNAGTKDPGFLPKNVQEYDRAIKEVAHYDEWKHGSHPLTRLCHTCRTVKPMRSKHCRICNRCVIQMDHHCPYIYNCVGYKNRVWFFTFTACVHVCCIITLRFLHMVISLRGWEILVTLGLLEAIFFLGISGIVFYFSIYHMVLNLTTNERINRSRYNYLKDGKGKYYNPYDRGWTHNILEFFHIKRPLEEDEVHFLNVTVV